MLSLIVLFVVFPAGTAALCMWIEHMGEVAARKADKRENAALHAAHPELWK